MKKSKIKREFSAGGVVYKKENGQVLWLVVKHSGYKKWILPKGLIDKGESGKKTALREVEEEAGVKARVMEKIKEPSEYFYVRGGERIFKRVDFYLMRYLSGSIKNHDWETEVVEWLPYGVAYKRLAFKGEKRVLARAKKILEEKEKQPKLV